MDNFDNLTIIDAGAVDVRKLVGPYFDYRIMPYTDTLLMRLRWRLAPFKALRTVGYNQEKGTYQIYMRLTNENVPLAADPIRGCVETIRKEEVEGAGLERVTTHLLNGLLLAWINQWVKEHIVT